MKRKKLKREIKGKVKNQNYKCDGGDKRKISGRKIKRKELVENRTKFYEAKKGKLDKRKEKNRKEGK